MSNITFIVDWGPSLPLVKGRYALIQESCLYNAWHIADSVAGPFKIAQLIIPKSGDIEGKYMEICSPENIYLGPKLDELTWYKSSDERFLLKWV